MVAAYGVALLSIPDSTRGPVRRCTSDHRTPTLLAPRQWAVAQGSSNRLTNEPRPKLDEAKEFRSHMWFERGPILDNLAPTLLPV